MTDSSRFVEPHAAPQVSNHSVFRNSHNVLERLDRHLAGGNFDKV